MSNKKEGNLSSALALKNTTEGFKRQFGGEGLAQVTVGQSGQPDAIQKYPAEYLAPDQHLGEIDKLAELNEAGIYGGQDGLFDRRQMTDKDVKAITNRLSQVKQIEFEEWLHANYNFNDPADVRFIREIYPEFFEKKIKFMEQTAELQKSLARMELNGGPKNFEDLVLKWALDTNQISTDRLARPVHDPLDPTRDREKFIIQRGVWNYLNFHDPMDQGGQFSRTAMHHRDIARREFRDVNGDVILPTRIDDGRERFNTIRDVSNVRNNPPGRTSGLRGRSRRMP